MGLLVVFLIPALLLVISAYNHHFNKRSIWMMVVFGTLMLGGFALGLFGPGPVVCLKNDYLVTDGGRSPIQLLYGDMDSCTVRFDSFKGEKFAVLTFKMKERRGFLVLKTLDVGVPNDASLERILTILRMKDVKVVE